MRERERGATLTEVLVVVTLMAVIAGPLYVMMSSAFRTERSQTSRADAERQLAFVVERFETDVRSGRPAADRLTTVGSTELAVVVDLSGVEQLVVWRIDGDELVRTVTAADSGALISEVTLVSDVDPNASTFAYLDPSGRAIAATDRAAIAACAVAVDMTITVETLDASARRQIVTGHRTFVPDEACP